VQPQILVVTDPPHRDVQFASVAALLGIEETDLRAKLGYPAPEVLLATDPGPAVDFASSLRNAGLSVAVIDGRELTTVPWPRPVTSFALTDDALVAQVDGGEVSIPYTASVVGVYCTPADNGNAGDAERSALMTNAADPIAVVEALEWSTLLDLYIDGGQPVERITFVRETTDFAGLGNARRSTAAENMATLLAELRHRFTDFALDARLEGVRPRARFVMGDKDFDYDLRKLYSFGTLLLRQILDAISRDLTDITQYELGSRLSYVLSRQRRTGR